MSDESKFFRKCKCSHCSLPVSYPAEMAGKTIECPHCKCQTILTEVKEVKEIEKVTPVPPPLAPVEPQGIVPKLEYVGELFLSLGFFGMVAAAIAAGVMRYNGGDANQTLWLVCIAFVSLLPGLFIKNLFFALAEIIRQLQSINVKVADSASARAAKAPDATPLPPAAPDPARK